MDTCQITAQSLAWPYHINGDEFERAYKDFLSGYRTWKDLAHADKWLVFPHNIGSYLSIDETVLSDGELYTIVSNKDASGIRRLKSDRADAMMIAEYAMRNYDKAVMYETLSAPLSQLRELFLYRQMVIRHRCSFLVRRGEKKLTMEKVSRQDNDFTKRQTYSVRTEQGDRKTRQENSGAD